MRKKLTDDLKAQCYDQYLNGMQQKDIASKYHLNKNTVSKIIKEMHEKPTYRLLESSINGFISEYERIYNFFNVKLMDLEQMIEKEPGKKLKIIALQCRIASDILMSVKEATIINQLESLKRKEGELLPRLEKI